MLQDGLRYLARYVSFLPSLPYTEELRAPYFSAITYFLMRKEPISVWRMIQTLADKAGTRGDSCMGSAKRFFTAPLPIGCWATLRRRSAISRATEHMSRIGHILRLVWNLCITAHIQLFTGQLPATPRCHSADITN